MATKKETKTVKLKFSKEDLLNSKVFADRKDILNVVLKDGEGVTIDEATKKIDAFMKGKVI